MKRFTILSILCFIFCITCGCMRKPPMSTLTNTFNKEEAQKLLEQGNSTITGSALLRQMGGGVVTCAGNQVSLIPLTKYSTERILAHYGKSESGYIPIINQKISGFTNDNSDYYKYGTKTTTCNAQGFFDFKNIKSGEYYLTTGIVWGDQYNPQGGFLMKKVDVLPNETKEVVITGY